VESLWLDHSLSSAGFVRAVAEVLPRLRPLEFFRPAQVDSAGNFNNIAFGKGYVEQGAFSRRSRLRLPGSGGIPDVTTFIDDIYLYVPRHSRVTFVPSLDVISGLGHHPARTHGCGPRYLVSDLGQFDFAGIAPNENAASDENTTSDEETTSLEPRRRMRLVSYHPRTCIEQVQAHTGFELEISPAAGPTPEPTEEELRILREEIDPLGIRRLEALSGAARRQLLHEILKKEK
jgi:acyl CoA:acetate/3-ketoacid CoA transferase beta subunit